MNKYIYVCVYIYIYIYILIMSHNGMASVKLNLMKQGITEVLSFVMRLEIDTVTYIGGELQLV